MREITDSEYRALHESVGAPDAVFTPTGPAKGESKAVRPEAKQVEAEMELLSTAILAGGEALDRLRKRLGAVLVSPDEVEKAFAADPGKADTEGMCLLALEIRRRTNELVRLVQLIGLLERSVEILKSDIVVVKGGNPEGRDALANMMMLALKITFAIYTFSIHPLPDGWEIDVDQNANQTVIDMARGVCTYVDALWQQGKKSEPTPG